MSSTPSTTVGDASGETPPAQADLDGSVLDVPTRDGDETFQNRPIR